MLTDNILMRACPAYRQVTDAAITDTTDGRGTATGRSRGAQTDRNHECETGSWEVPVPC